MKPSSGSFRKRLLPPVFSIGFAVTLLAGQIAGCTSSFPKGSGRMVEPPRRSGVATKTSDQASTIKFESAPPTKTSAGLDGPYRPPRELLPGPTLVEGKIQPGLAAYTMSNARHPSPPDRVGGPLTVTITQNEGGSRLVIPGPRFLDPAVFGTPENPTGFDPAPFPLIGTPLHMRRIRNGRYTFVNHPTPFSDWKVVGKGSVKMTVVDHTAIDGARTKDKIDLEITFKLPGPDPDDPESGATPFKVVCTQPLPHGGGFPVFGGVVTNHLLHGGTGIGTRLMPTEFTHVATWGKGTIYKNGQPIAKDHMIHTMVTQIVRHGDYELNFDHEMGKRPLPGTVLHLMVPPYKPGPKGMVKSPVFTGFIPFPYIKKFLGEDFKKAQALPPSERKERLADLGEIKQMMNWTKKTVMQKVIDDEMFGMPFIHIMFSDLKIEYRHE